jgi:hypothetical protein
MKSIATLSLAALLVSCTPEPAPQDWFGTLRARYDSTEYKVALTQTPCLQGYEDRLLVTVQGFGEEGPFRMFYNPQGEYLGAIAQTSLHHQVWKSVKALLQDRGKNEPLDLDEQCRRQGICVR